MDTSSALSTIINMSKSFFNVLDKKTTSITKSPGIGDTVIKKCPFLNLNDFSGVVFDSSGYDDKTKIENHLADCLNVKCQMWVSTSPSNNSDNLVNQDEFTMITGFPLVRGSITPTEQLSNGEYKPNGRCGLQTADYAELSYRLAHHYHMAHKHNIQHANYNTTINYMDKIANNYPYNPIEQPSVGILLNEATLKQDSNNDGVLYNRDFIIKDSVDKPEVLRNLDSSISNQPWHMVEWSDYQKGIYPPMVKSITPNYGDMTGGTYVEIIGGFFKGNMDLFKVKINEVEVTDYNVKRDGILLYLRTPAYTGTELTKSGDEVSVNISIETFGNTFDLIGTIGENATNDGLNNKHGIGGLKVFNGVYKYVYDKIIDTTYLQQQHDIMNARPMVTFDSSSYIDLNCEITDNYIVSFEDSVIEFIAKHDLNKALGTTKQGPIYIDELQKITSLDPSDIDGLPNGIPISTLNDLKLMTNLKTIKLDTFDFTTANIDQLQTLTKLETISLINSNLGSISSFSNKPNLLNLDLSGNVTVNNISSLADSKRLISLNISELSLSDLSVFSNFKYLQILKMTNNNNNMTITDFTPFSYLKSLVLLELDGLDVGTNLDSLITNCKYLEYLSLKNCGLTAIDNLSNLMYLKKIDISDNAELDGNACTTIQNLIDANVEVIYNFSCP